MTREQVDKFEKLSAQIDSLHQEMSVLAKKSPNDVVNIFKIRFINAALEQWNDLLGEKYRPFPGFSLFSIDDLPSNSDVTFIVSQYIECAEKLRSDNIEDLLEYGWCWSIPGKQVPTAAPRKLLRK